MNNRQAVIAPIITEKAMKASEGGSYSFLVRTDATKTAIKQEVAKRFGVSVVGVKTSVVKGRTKRVGSRRIEVSQSAMKRAMVRLKKGETIGVFEPGGGEEKADKKKK